MTGWTIHHTMKMYFLLNMGIFAANHVSFQGCHEHPPRWAFSKAFEDFWQRWPVAPGEVWWKQMLERNCWCFRNLSASPVDMDNLHESNFIGFYHYLSQVVIAAFLNHQREFVMWNPRVGWILQQFPSLKRTWHNPWKIGPNCPERKWLVHRPKPLEFSRGQSVKRYAEVSLLFAENPIMTAKKTSSQPMYKTFKTSSWVLMFFFDMFHLHVQKS